VACGSAGLARARRHGFGTLHAVLERSKHAPDFGCGRKTTTMVENRPHSKSSVAVERSNRTRPPPRPQGTPPYPASRSDRRDRKRRQSTD
jgi:hypothetical protein